PSFFQGESGALKRKLPPVYSWPESSSPLFAFLLPLAGGNCRISRTTPTTIPPATTAAINSAIGRRQRLGRRRASSGDGAMVMPGFEENTSAGFGAGSAAGVAAGATGMATATAGTAGATGAAIGTGAGAGGVTAGGMALATATGAGGA